MMLPLVLLLASSLLAAAVPMADPLAEPFPAPLLPTGFFDYNNIVDTANEMEDLIKHKDASKCPVVVVIFAKGTFDDGNIGVFVGPQFRHYLEKVFGRGKVMFQGVNGYPATLEGYLQQKGDDKGAENMAKIMNAFAAICPKTVMIPSGWSQGALVCHKAMKHISAPTLKRIAGMVTFGDPNEIWDNIPTPVPLNSECITAGAPDFLCAKDKWHLMPKSLDEFKALMLTKAYPGDMARQTVALGKVLGRLVSQLFLTPSNTYHLVKNFFNLGGGKRARVLLLPQHFGYGNNGMAEKAAKWAKTKVDAHH